MSTYHKEQEPPVELRQNVCKVLRIVVVCVTYTNAYDSEDEDYRILGGIE
jgi:hypothetical protein